LGRLDSLINNTAEQHPQESIAEITSEQLEKTFRTNIFSMFYLTKAALKHLKAGSTIVNTTSVTTYKGSPKLHYYAATKGAIAGFTHSLSLVLSEQKIRVNGVVPDPIWTPLIPTTFPPERVKTFGEDVPMGLPGQQEEVANCFVFLASDDASYVKANYVYIVTSGIQALMEGSRFRLSPLVKKAGWLQKIPIFLQPLARHQSNRAIAVILSGLDADGAALRPVKKAGGIIIAQDFHNAKHPYMPLNAVNTGCVDFLLSLIEIVKKTTSHCDRAYGCKKV
jgi:short-subunit dehydrogenase